MITEVTIPFNNTEEIFVIIQLFVGVVLFAIIVGNVGSVIINMSMAKREFQDEMDKIKQYLKFHQLPQHVQRRVIKWFEYLKTNKQTFNEDRVRKSKIEVC